MNKTMISLGNFFFKHRNRLFPLMVVAIFLLQPPASTFLGDVWAGEMRTLLAWGIALSGLLVRGLVIGYAYIKRGGLNKKVYAEHLVTSGMFGVCRNPLYVGNMLIYAGVFLLHGDLLVSVFGISLFFFIYQCIIAAEEAYLHEHFGEGYRAYCHDVARWMPNLARYRASVEGMALDWRKAIKKDYSTIATTLAMLTLTGIYRTLYAAPDSFNTLIPMGATLLGLGVFAGTIRYIKKHPKASV